MSAVYGVSVLDPVLFKVVPVLVIVGFLAALAAAMLAAGNREAMTPVLTVDCHVAGKRAAPGAHFVTFEMNGGSHVEFAVRDADYSLLTEGDAGSLTFQGEQYLGFEREL